MKGTWVLQQDREAFDGFVHATLPRLLSVGQSLTRDERAGANLVQDALERSLLRWSKIREDDPERHVMSVMLRRSRPLVQRIHRRPVGDVPEPTEVTPAPRAEDVEALLAAVHRRARHRRQGRIGVVAAGVLALLTTTGVIPSPGGVPESTPGDSPAPTSTPSGPASGG